MKLAFCIPAYNNPKYLFKCLESLCLQKNKTFDILISDDCSPIGLEPVVSAIRQKYHDSINIEYERQPVNLGIYWNTRKIFDKSNHQYKIIMQHDDQVIDKLFTEKIFDIFDKFDECAAIVFNAITEFTHKKTFTNTKECFIDGKYYVSNHLFRDIHPSYSSVVLNTKLLDLDAYNSLYVPKTIARKLEIEIDENFQILTLISAEGKVFISENIVTIRGEPKTAATQRNMLPFKTAAQGMLVSYYQLYKIMKQKGLDACAEEMAKQLTHVFPSPIINWKLIKFFKYEVDFIKFHIYGVFVRNTRRIKNFFK